MTEPGAGVARGVGIATNGYGVNDRGSDGTTGDSSGGEVCGPEPDDEPGTSGVSGGLVTLMVEVGPDGSSDVGSSVVAHGRSWRRSTPPFGYPRVGDVVVVGRSDVAVGAATVDGTEVTSRDVPGAAGVVATTGSSMS